MIEIRYEKSTGIITGMWASRFGNWDAKLRNRPNEAMVELDINKPDNTAKLLYNETTGELVNNPDYEPPEPPHSTHLAILEEINTGNVRPAKVKRTWEGNDYYYDCFVTENVKDQYVAGDINIGDYVIVFFSDAGEPIVTGKVFRSW